LKDHLNRNSYRILEIEAEISRKTICSLTTRVTGELIHSNELTKIMQPQNYCGILLIDGKFVPVRDTKKAEFGFLPKSAKRRGKTKGGLVIISYIDYLTHDIPIYEISLSENMYDIEAGFRKLKEIGYPLRVVVCDESMGETAQVAKKIFPNVFIQTCLTHYGRAIDRTFKAKAAKRSIKALENRLKKMNGNFLISTCHYARAQAISIVNRISELEFEYGYLIKIEEIFQDIFWKAKDLEELNYYENELNVAIGQMDLKRYPYEKRIKDRYLDYYEKREQIVTSIMHPELKIPRTTNLIEGYHSTTLEIRFTSIRGFKTQQNARNYINALILKYRFHKFTDCKTQFKNLNGRSPLEIAEPKNHQNFRIDDWVRFCRNLKKRP